RRRGRTRPQRDDDLLDAAVAQIVGMGVALAAIADDRDLLRLDQIHIRIAVVIHTHGKLLWIYSPPRHRGNRVFQSSSRQRPGPTEQLSFGPPKWNPAFAGMTNLSVSS